MQSEPRLEDGGHEVGVPNGEPRLYGGTPISLQPGFGDRRTYLPINSSSATTVDSTPAVTAGCGEILNNGE